MIQILKIRYFMKFLGTGRYKDHKKQNDNNELGNQSNFNNKKNIKLND